MARANIALSFIQDLTGLKATDQAVSKTTRGVQAMNKAMAAVGTGFAIAAVARGMKQVIDLAKEQAGSMAQLEAAVESTGGAAGFTAQELAKMAREFQKVTLFGDEVTMRMQAVLLTFTKIGRDVLPMASEAVLNVATRMQTDLRSAALQLGKALNDPIRGLDGLQRAGIQFSDAQKLVIKALAESGKMAEAQFLILEELESQFGNAARAAASAAGGGIDQLTNALSDMGEEIGSELLPAIDTLSRELTGLAGNEAATGFIAKLVTQFTPAVQAIRLLTAAMDALTREDEGGSLSERIEAALTGGAGGAAGALEPVNQNLENIAATMAEIAEIERQIELHEEFENLQVALADAEARMRGLIAAEAERRRLLALDPFNPFEVADPDDIDFELIAATFGDEVQEELTRAILAAGVEAGPSFGDDVGKAVASAIGRALASGDITSAMQGLGNAVASAASTAISGAIPGLGGSLLGALAGGGISAIFGSLFGDKGPPPWVPQFVGSVDVFAVGARQIGDAAQELSEAALDVRRSLGGLGDGSLLEAPTLFASELDPLVGGGFSAKLFDAGRFVVAGVGDSVGAATRDALDQFAQRLPELIASGTVSTEGFDPAIATALAEFRAVNFADLTASVQAWNDSLNSVAATLGAFTPETDAAMQRLAALRLEIERSGLSAAAAAPFLAELAKAEQLLLQQRQAGFFNDIASIMERAGINSAQAARFRLIAEQKITQLKLIELEITARSLGLWTEAWARLFGQLNAWAANVNNFVVSTASITAPVIRAAPRISSGLGNALRDARESLRDFLAALNFQAPGSPTPGRTGLEAALAEARRAAGLGDVEGFKSAASAAADIARELFGSTLGFDAVIEAIRQIGQFDPKVESNPVVGAINSGFDRNIGAINTGLDDVDLDLDDIDDDLVKINEDQPPPIPVAPTVDDHERIIEDIFRPILERQTRAMNDRSADDTDQIVRALGGGNPLRVVVVSGPEGP